MERRFVVIENGDKQVVGWKDNYVNSYQSVEGSVAKETKVYSTAQISRNKKRPHSKSIRISEKKFISACKMFIIVYAVSIVIAVVIATICGYNLGKKQQEVLPYTSTTTYTVKSGDTLWTIAEDISNNTYDIRRVVYEIEDINNLKSSKIYPWQELILPVLK